MASKLRDKSKSNLLGARTLWEGAFYGHSG